MACIRRNLEEKMLDAASCSSPISLVATKGAITFVIRRGFIFPRVFLSTVN